jgi:hypothetical protein
MHATALPSALAATAPPAGATTSAGNALHAAKIAPAPEHGAV